jgi:hypothetical protein
MRISVFCPIQAISRQAGMERATKSTIRQPARAISDQAVDKAGETSGQMDGLGQAAEGIGKVVETITEIFRASQPAGPERNDRGRPGR